MGTRSRIAIRNADNTYISIYCHWDGYPSHVGALLIKHYATEEKARELLALGNLSSLRENIGQKHKFNSGQGRDNRWTTAYSRDRGEADQEAEEHADLDALKAAAQNSGAEWVYIFTPAGWQCAPGGFSAFGAPATEQADGFEAVDYWIQREAHDND